MKIGDAHAELWRSSARWHYCLDVWSSVRGENGKHRYWWQVSRVPVVNPELEEHVNGKRHKAPTWAAAYRAAMRAADKWERTGRKP